jgi:hypothetical protein
MLKSQRLLLREQAMLVERGVRPMCLEGLSGDSPVDCLRELWAAVPETTTIPFSLTRHLSGYASHSWVIDLLNWTHETAPQRRRNQIYGLLLGYSPESIADFEKRGNVDDFRGQEVIVMEPYDKGRKCPQDCGGASTDKYHNTARPGESWQCSAFPLPHMHRTCNNCEYEWAETPLT